METTRRTFLHAVSAAASISAAHASFCQPKVRATPAVADVTLRFGGLMVLGISPGATAATLAAARVLMIDFDRSQAAGHGRRHVPALRIRLSDVVQGDPDWLDPRDPGVGIWDLLSQRVAIDRNPADAQIRTVPVDPGIACPIGAQWADLRWIANPAKFLAGNDGKLKASLVGDVDAFGTLVASKIPLRGGLLYAEAPNLPACRSSRLRFPRGGAFYYQPATDRFRFVLPDVEQVRFALTLFGALEPRKTIAIKPGTAATVEFTNFLLPGPPTVMISHFPIMYGLLQTPPTEATVPTTVACDSDVASVCQQGGRPDDPVYCPPMLGYL